MKRFLSVAFAVILLACLLVVSSGAANEPTAALEANVETAYRGDTVTVTVSVDGATGVESLGVELSYDKNVFLWEETQWVELDGMYLDNEQLSYGVASCAFSPAADLSGEILTLTFKVKNGAAFDVASIGAFLRIKTGDTVKTVDASTTLGIVCKHSFTNARADEMYLKEAATCKKPAEYWKTCSICNEMSSEDFFTVGAALPHTKTEVATEKYLKDAATCTIDAVYYKSCSVCEEAITSETFEVEGKLDHTKTEVAIYKYLKSSATCLTPAVYYASCSVCEIKIETETFAYGGFASHKKVEVPSEKYLKDEATCTSKAVYYKSCSVCEEAITSETFVYGSFGSHKYGAWIKHNGDQHKRVCGCGDTQYEDHDFDASQKCTVCSATTFIVGDLDGNARVDKNDAIYLLMYTFFEDKYPIEQAIDYTRDGRITKDDAIYLLMYTFFEDKYPLDPLAAE